MELVIIGAAIGCMVMWAILVCRRLTILNENVSRAMSRIGVQLSLCFDAVMEFLEETGRYAGDPRIIMEAVNRCRTPLTGSSTPEEVKRQENVLSDALRRIRTAAAKYPGLTKSRVYVGTMGAVDGYLKTADTGRLIYNDNVTKLNRELIMFPTSLMGRMLGLNKREYLEATEFIKE